MSSARIVARRVSEPALLWILWLVLVSIWIPRPARADETTPGAAAQVAPPTASVAAKIESSTNAEAPAPGGAVPTPKVAADSIVTSAPALRDSSGKAPDAPGSAAKDTQPAERIENAVTTSSEKTAEVAPALSPTGVNKPADTPSKVSKPLPGTGAARKPRVSMGIRGGATRALKPAPKNRPLLKAAPRNQNGAALHEFTEADRVQSELERTERFVGRAQKSIVSSKNTRAIKLFTSALDFQSDSREAAKVRQYARAERLTLAARDFADRASRMVGPPREDPDYVEHVLRRTDDALERADDVLRTGAGRTSWSQHEDLKAEQKEAWRIFKAGDVGGAYRETQGVREGVLALLRQLQDLPVPRETAEKAIGGAQMALEQANRELGPRPSIEAARLVKLANEYLAKARQSFSRGSYRSALLQAKVVERHVEHAVDVGRPRSG
jgi:hypothetical protein